MNTVIVVDPAIFLYVFIIMMQSAYHGILPASKRPYFENYWQLQIVS